MTYITGGPIQASDFNTFTTAAGGINEVYSDLHSGATTVASGADYGYGQGTLVGVSVGNPVAASSWSTLFSAMRNIGTHQGTTTVPPLPATGPAAGEIVAAIAAVPTLITTLRTNRFNLGVSQTSQTLVTSTGTSAPWTNTLTYTFDINLGTWDQARYFFNAGGSIGIFGNYPGSGFPVSSDDYQWYDFLNTVGTISFKAKNTTSLVSNQSLVDKGLWDSAGSPLTTSYQEVFKRTYGGAGYYSNSTLIVQAKLSAAAPASGIINFEVILTQADSSVPVDAKTLSTTFQLSENHASGVVAWPGSAAFQNYTNTFVRT
jgi:hypothetical protein